MAQTSRGLKRLPNYANGQRNDRDFEYAGMDPRMTPKIVDETVDVVRSAFEQY